MKQQLLTILLLLVAVTGLSVHFVKFAAEKKSSCVRIKSEAKLSGMRASAGNVEIFQFAKLVQKSGLRLYETENSDHRIGWRFQGLLDKKALWGNSRRWLEVQSIDVNRFWTKRFIIKKFVVCGEGDIQGWRFAAIKEFHFPFKRHTYRKLENMYLSDPNPCSLIQLELCNGSIERFIGEFFLLFRNSLALSKAIFCGSSGPVSDRELSHVENYTSFILPQRLFEKDCLPPVDVGLYTANHQKARRDHYRYFFGYVGSWAMAMTELSSSRQTVPEPNWDRWFFLLVGSALSICGFYALYYSLVDCWFAAIGGVILLYFGVLFVGHGVVL